MGERSWVVVLIEAVFFDVGGTVLDESSEFARWADWLEVPRHTLSAVLGAVIARGQDFLETFRIVRPDLAGTELERDFAAAHAGLALFTEEDLYPDARPCLAALKDQGLLVGLAGNQPAAAAEVLQTLGLAVDVIGTSEGWGAAKPSREFFERVVDAGGGDA